MGHHGLGPPEEGAGLAGGFLYLEKLDLAWSAGCGASECHLFLILEPFPRYTFSQIYPHSISYVIRWIFMGFLQPRCLPTEPLLHAGNSTQAHHAGRL